VGGGGGGGAGDGGRVADGEGSTTGHAEPMHAEARR